jgi:uncharacterized protein (DUF2141 family)
VRIVLKRLRIVAMLLSLWSTIPFTSANETTTRLTGVVLDPAGAVISAASIRLFSSEELREAKANEGGKFEFVDLPSGTYELRIWSPGFSAKIVKDLKVSPTESPSLSITLLVEPSPCGDATPVPEYGKRSGDTNLEGRISAFWDGYVAHATVTVTQLSTGRKEIVTTGKSGEFQFVGLEPGRYSLAVSHDRYGEQSRVEFWITAKNLTRFHTIYIFRKFEHRTIACE